MDRVKEMVKLLRMLSQEENREALRLVLQELIYILKHARFRDIRGSLILGVDDPYQMGQLLSALSFAYPMYGRSLEIQPLFGQEELSGEVRITGHLRLFHVVKAAIVLLRDETIRGMLLQRAGKA